jgi:hypothetical protein
VFDGNYRGRVGSVIEKKRYAYTKENEFPSIVTQYVLSNVAFLFTVITYFMYRRRETSDLFLGHVSPLN